MYQLLLRTVVVEALQWALGRVKRDQKSIKGTMVVIGVMFCRIIEEEGLGKVGYLLFMQVRPCI